MRNFRLDDDVYKAAQTRARNDFTTVTAVIERALRVYAGMPSSDLEAALGPMDAAMRAFKPYSKKKQLGDER